MGEIRRIQDVLNPDENVIIVARQSRILPGGSYVTLILFTRLKNG